MSIPTSSERAAIADAVAARIAAGVAATVFTVARPPVVKRCYLALDTLNGLSGTAGPLVTVLPIGPELRARMTRASTEKDLDIQIGIQQRLSQPCTPEAAAGNIELDALALFAEQVAVWLEPDQSATPPRTGILTCAGGMQVNWMRTKVFPYSTDHLISKRVFTTTLTITYRRY